MRRRSYTSIAKLLVKEQDVRQQLQILKMDHSILQQKYESLEAERDVLKEGNSNLVSQFLFDKHRQELTRLSDSLKEKNLQMTELRKVLQQMDKVMKGFNWPKTTNYEIKEKPTANYEHSSNFTIRITEDKKLQSLWGKKPEINPQQVRDNLIKLKQIYEKETRVNKELEEQNVELGKQIQFLRANLQQISNDLQSSAPQELIKTNQDLMQKIQDIVREMHQLRSQNTKLSELLKQNKEQSKIKEKQLAAQNKELSQKIKQLDRQVRLRKSSVQNNEQKPSFRQTRFNQTQINMSVSICNTQDMKKSLIYQKLSESCMQESIVTESYDKRLSKLEKTNTSLEKDYKNSQEKIKSINREYSKLKLDYLKLSEDCKLREDQFERRIEILNNKLQSASKRAKQHDNIVSSIKNEKQMEKSTLKSIILGLQSKHTEQESQIQQLKLQIQPLKKQLEATKNYQQTTTENKTHLQNQKNKNKMLKKQIQQKSKDFQKTLKQYESIIQDLKKISLGQRQDSKHKYFARSDQKSLQKMTGSSSSLISPQKKLNSSRTDLNIRIEGDSIMKTLKSQVQALQMNLKLQNERCNVLESSNRQLRKQLLKMIDQEQKLRKDLISQKIKTKTKSMSSKNSRGFSSRRFKEDFSEQKNQRKLNQCGSNLYLPIGAKLQNNNQYNQRHTERSFDSAEIGKGLYQSNSNSQIVMNTERSNVNEVRNFQTSNQGSYLKAMRQRRFDPKETSNTVTVKQSYLTERNPPHPNGENLTERKNALKERVSIEVQQQSAYKDIDSTGFSQLFSPVVNKSQNQAYKTPISKKIFNEVNSAQTMSSMNAQRQNEKEKGENTGNEPKSNSVKKYVYQPPKKYIPGLKMVTSITTQNQKQSMQKKDQMIVHEQKEEEQISLSNDNREITLEISSSKSNCSRADMIIESANCYNKASRSKPLKEPHSDRKIQYTEMFEDRGKDVKNNIVLLGGKVQQTKSHTEVRFMRKN